MVLGRRGAIEVADAPEGGGNWDEGSIDVGESVNVCDSEPGGGGEVFGRGIRVAVGESEGRLERVRVATEADASASIRVCSTLRSRSRTDMACS